jgi:hypothetical protein
MERRFAFKNDFKIVIIVMTSSIGANVHCGKWNCNRNPSIGKSVSLDYTQLIDSFLIPLQ